jgi:hypothetical protein
MTMQNSFHAQYGAEFLGLRLSRRGQIEVVYDDGANSRRIWRVIDPPHLAEGDIGRAAHQIADALRIAAADTRVLPRLQVELDLREIALETVLH